MNKCLDSLPIAELKEPDFENILIYKDEILRTLQPQDGDKLVIRSENNRIVLELKKSRHRLKREFARLIMEKLRQDWPAAFTIEVLKGKKSCVGYFAPEVPDNVEFQCYTDTAISHPNDTFDPSVGCAIAMLRALKVATGVSFKYQKELDYLAR